MHPKRIVEHGYDAISDRYTSWSLRHDWPARRAYVRLLIDSLPRGARVVELGCGAGIPATADLAQHFAVTGIDISGEQIRRARKNVPNATFIHADMAAVDLPAGAFDGAAAFYSITHLPREEQPSLLRQVKRWLRPGGLFVASMAAGEADAWYESDWLGAPMYFSHFGAETNLGLLDEAGFDVAASELITQDEGELGKATFCWVVAKARGG